MIVVLIPNLRDCTQPEAPMTTIKANIPKKKAILPMILGVVKTELVTSKG